MKFKNNKQPPMNPTEQTKQLAEKQNLSGTQLSKKAGINPSVLHKWFNGKDVQLTTFIKIIDALGYVIALKRKKK